MYLTRLLMGHHDISTHPFLGVVVVIIDTYIVRLLLMYTMDVQWCW